MATRTTTKEVVFRRPFLLSGFESVQPAGTYTIETEEELIETLSFPAWRRIATVIILTRGATTECISVDPDELHEALMRDSAQPDASTSTGSSSPQSRQRKARDTMNAYRVLGKRY